MPASENCFSSLRGSPELGDLFYLLGVTVARRAEACQLFTGSHLMVLDTIWFPVKSTLLICVECSECLKTV